MNRQNIEDLYALSPLQQGMLFHALLDPTGGAYVEQLTLVLEGEFHPAEFHRGWQAAVARHPVLRTALAWEKMPKPLQVVFRTAELPMDLRDVSHLPRAEQRAEVDAFLEADRRRGFDLTAAPLLRLTVFRNAERLHTVVVSVHHVVLDGWSLPIVYHEVLHAYEAALAGQEARIPAPRPFREYISWLGKQDLSQAEAFWRRTLAGVTEPTSLNPAGPSHADAPGDYGRASLRVTAERTAALLAFARAHKVTLNTLFQGAWALLLSRYTGREDVVFGTTVSGRPPELPGVNGMVGMFINTLAVRATVRPSALLPAWLAELQHHATEARQFEHTPLVEVQGWSELPRDRPLFDTLFVFENYPQARHAAGAPPPALRVVETASPERTSYPLAVAAAPTAEGTELRATYSTRLLSPEAAERLLGQMAALLDAFVAHPHAKLGDLSILTEADRRVLDEWSGHETEYPRDACIAALFDETAAAAPDAVAVTFGGERVTYAELGARANRLAHHLHAAGVRPGDRVGVSVERSVEMVVSLLAVLKAGAAYVPLDAGYPAERLVWMLEDSGAAVLVVRGEVPAALSAFAGRVVSLDAERDCIAARSPESPGVAVPPNAAAQVIYTSGSTGRPKGAQVPQRAVIRLVRGNDFADVGPDHVVMQIAPVSFDASTFELFGALLNGATLAVFPPGAPSLEELGDFLLRERVTTALLTSGLFHQLVDGNLASLRGLRQLLAGGDVLSVPHVRRVVEAYPRVRMVNVYGPTENATFTACHTVVPGDVERASIPIGRPVANTRVYVLDGEMRPVPAGVPGELYTGGDGLATAYLNRPARTAGSFVPDPFSGDGGRLYRTGDRARWLDDGTLEFLGRIDEQVKIRGFRVEPGEVEAALDAHPRVASVSVIAREDEPGDKRLVAYVVAAGADGGSASPETHLAEELKAYLAARLPAHMVPSAFVAMDVLPLNANGKVDRRALPAPDRYGAAAQTYVAPRSEAEEKLARIWAEVLGRERVGVHDNFFDIGGHSLRATQVISRIRDALGTAVPMRAFFDTPTVAALVERFGPDAKRDDADSASAAEDGRPPISRVPRDRPLPLSFAQERLWFLDQMEPGGAAYNMPAALRLSGALEVRALEAALGEIVARHESLRTTFTAVDGRPVQVVAPASPFTLPVEVVEAADEHARDAEVHRRAAEEATRPFDLAAGPLFRASLLRLGEREHVLLLAMHHVVSDGWSMGVFVRELTALYEAFGAGRPSPLAPLAVQYPDFAAWQREHLSGAALDDQLAYWRGALAGAPALLELPTDRPRPATQTFPGAIYRFGLPASLQTAVGEVARREGATPFMVLLAAFQALLARWSGQDDVVVGTPIAGRVRAELEPLIGFFVNTLALRADLGGDPTFAALLGRVKETTLGAFAHQEVPFEKLVEELNVERSLAHGPVFQVMFALQNAEMGGLRLGGVELGMVDAGTGTSRFEMTVSMMETEDGLSGTVEYNTDLFDESTIARLAEQFGTLLEAATAVPERRLSAVDLLSGDERRRVLGEWSGRTTDYPRTSSVHALFAAKAAETPDALAVKAGDARLTYAELDARSNRLARHLQSLGAGAGSRVGLSMQRSAEMVVTLLAILKAGAAYVPLDPAYPAERLAFMLTDSAVSVLLVDDAVPAALSSFSGTVVSLSASAERIAAQSPASPDVAVPAEATAYVIYTSGSTGQPKGVAVPHRAVVRLVRGNDFADSGPDHVFLQLAPVAFDASTFEVWGALLNGAALAVFPPHTPSLEELGGFLVREKVTTAWLTAGLFHQMVDERLDDLGALRQLLAGGDVLSVPHVRRVIEAHPHLRVINGYGPTEGTTFTCCHTVVPGDVERGSIPIGRPVANTRIYVLDRAMQPVPAGVPGELYIGGDGLAHGYLNRPELTAEKFVADLFSADGDARLYRSGDRVRWLADGTVEFLGRMDEQVKIRGFRIEPGEIEAALAAHPRIRTASVVAREDAGGGKRLVAYVIAAADGVAFTASTASATSTEALASTEAAASSGPSSSAEAQASSASADVLSAEGMRAWLRRTLPEYMVPAAFVWMDALPLTANGKVDRRALPAPEHAEAAGEYVAPRTETERAMAAIWAEVLEAPRVGVEDGFFDLGGHSLIATRVMSKVRQAFGVELPLRAIFEAPTVAGLSARVDAALAAGDDGRAPPIVRREHGGRVPLSFAQERMWFLDQMESTGSAYNLPLVLRIEGALDVDALRRALNEIVARHDVLRTTYPVVNGEPVQHVADDLVLPLPVQDLSHLPPAQREEEMRHVAAAESWRRFDLASGPIVRASLLRLGEEEHAFVLVMHHIAGDGWSLGVLSAELGALYEAFKAGDASPLPPLAVQYADYAAWQREWLSGDELERQLGYWRGHLSGAPAAIDLPTDRPRPPVQTFSGALEWFDLPRGTGDALDRLARGEGATPFMVLLAVFQLLLSRWSGQEDVVVGTPIAGRAHGETEPLIGFFVNTLALRGDLSGDPTFRELARRARAAALGGFAHQELPFEKLVGELAVERSTSHTPVFQVMFSLQNVGLKGLDLPGLRFSEIGTDIDTAKFDLSLTAVETPDGIRAAFEYNTDLFDAETVRRMARHFSALAASAASAPDAPISRLAMLSAEEREEAVGRWNRTERDWPDASPVHRLFEARAAATPDAVALEQAGERVTYAELNAQANRIAHHLAALGAGPESRVGVCLERSPEMVAGLLGILKAGAAYVPLDPVYPAERLAYLAEDAGLRIALTTLDLSDRLPPGVVPVLLDADAQAIAARPSTDPAVVVHAESLAYVIYTSGSTGKPKGVLVPHGGVANYTRFAAREYTLTSADRFLQFANISFDASVEELFAPLATGGTLVLRTDAMIASPAAFLSLCGEWGITALSLPTAYWHQVAAAMAADGLALPESVRMVVIGGERALPERVADWQDAVDPRVVLYNSYGPTEATVAATFTVVADGAGRAEREISIGLPVDNDTAYVLDDAGQPVPVGVPGELCLGGAGVVRGYLGRPGLTAEKFVPDPFSARPGARLYRTGDRARRRPNGELEFLRRADDQVKVRGFRVELGEIESLLREADAVAEAVVVAGPDARGETRLAAYLVAEEGAAPAVPEIRSALRERLPEYMVPGAFVVVDSLPLTPNGKIDRAALPIPEPDAADAERGTFAPLRSPLEETLAGIWSEVLGVERVGAHDNFFDLGGRSLLLAQVHERIRTELGREVGMVSLFKYPTVRLLADFIARDADDGVETTERGRERAAARRESRDRRRERR